MTMIQADNRRYAPRVPESELERYSSAATLSDMEIFVFPDLLFSLILANLTSPRLWAWRDDDWFRSIAKLSPYRRVQRLKQYIIDHYEFNLDLDTWGITEQATELKRFARWIDEETVSRSNALFGYEGDQYYFDLDIRKHFGLDQYGAEVIPYWKTETLEAMDAFTHREGYALGAGECVSLSTLYAAAMFVVCGISLDHVYSVATPLHSQNFIAIQDGILTNNRRIVTKNMWFNGTEQTYKAQRALRHEQVTIVAHHSGYIHTVYPEATIDPTAYEAFKKSLAAYLTTDVNMEILANFLRQHSDLQKCFQFCYDCHGKGKWIEAEKVYAYEHTGPYKASDKSRDKLLAEIDEYYFYTEKIPGRICINLLEAIFSSRPFDLSNPEHVKELEDTLDCECNAVHEVMARLIEFTRLQPRFPDATANKTFVATDEPLGLNPEMSREEILARLESIRERSRIADLSFYAARDLARTDWTPFAIGAIQRNPVSILAAEKLSDEEVVARLREWPDESIYGESRCAHPDEVWNYARGDGFEKALCLANILHARHPEAKLHLEVESDTVILTRGEERWTFASSKGLSGSIQVGP
ncbi:MAG: hypothetical protein KDL31_11590 [Kiritimatiellae bacterium]|nr:hypothetical protein [Kiritimatiellia bacterium]